MIKLLPYWVVSDTLPAFYETEGATAIQMVAKIYGKVNEMIDDYNHFVDEINSTIAGQDEKIQEAIEYMKDNIVATASELFEQALRDGDITANLNLDYNPSTEELIFSIESGDN